MPAAPARQLWASTLRGGTARASALSPDGTRLFVLGYVGPSVKSETVAYSTATGAQLWATTYPPENTGGPDESIAVSPDGAQVYVTGYSIRLGAVTIAYAAGTGRQLWASRYKHKGAGLSGLAVSPDGTTVYEAGTGSVSGRGSYIAVIAYDAATGHQRWLRYYTRVKPAGAALGGVAVSPDGTTVYVAGQAGALLPSSYSLIVLAYRATGTLKWATRYANRYTGGAYAGGAFGGPIVLGPGGRDLYVAGTVSSKYGHHVAATFAFRAATGTRLWVDPDKMQDVKERHANPLGDVGPAFFTREFGDVAPRRAVLEVSNRERCRLMDHAIDGKPPVRESARLKALKVFRQGPEFVREWTRRNSVSGEFARQ